MKNKFLYPYIIIEFALFIGIFFFVLNPIITFNYRILVSVGLGFNLIFSILLKPKEKIDIYFVTTMSLFLFVGELLYLLTKNLLLYLILTLLGLFVVTARLFIKVKDNPKIKIVTVIIFLLCHLVLLGLLMFNVFGLEYFLTFSIIIILLTNIVLMIQRYRNEIIEHKPNYFFGSIGSLIFATFIVCMIFGPLMDDTAALKEFVSLGSSVLIIPSVLMMSLSFTLFELREA